MAHFIGRIDNDRTAVVTRLGTAGRGMHVDADGWAIGGSVEIRCHNGVDVVTLLLTSGSGRGIWPKAIGSWKRVDNKFVMCNSDGSDIVVDFGV